MRTFFVATALSLASVVVAPAALAAGFGQGPGSVPMGSPLVVALPVLLDEGDVLEPECVSAEVSIGDRRVPPFNVRWVLEPGAGPRDRVVRVGTLVNVDEPLVTVQLNVGCANRISRRFTVFADPPAVAAAPPALADVQQVAGLATESTRPTAQAAAGPGQRLPMPSPRVKALAATGVDGTSSAEATSPAEAKPARPAKAAKAPRTATAPRAAVAKADAGPSARTAARAVAPRSRLTLEAAEPPLPDETSAAIAEAASAVTAAMQTVTSVQAAASAANARARSLEAQVEKLLADGKQMQAENQQLRRRLASTDSGSGWVPWLLGVIALLAAASVWLGLRLRRLRRLAHAQWWKAAQAAEAQPEVEANPAAVARPAAALPQKAATPAPAPPAWSAAPPARAPEPVSASIPTTMIVEPGWTTQTPPRAVTVEELIDLEQQAEFFVVLGQDDAAIDLLVGHIRSTGGISPLPYLKLLEIYRRRGETDSYERTRARFNQRFNAYAPDWDADLQHGRLLEDYPEVIASMQRAWSNPTVAMATLEDLLFRKDGGQMFDLPAYREVLLLYSLARDLLDHGGAAPASIDLLLPIEAAVQRAARLPRRPDETLPVQPQVSFDRTATPPALDLDLSLFAEFDTEVTQPGAFTELERGMDSRLADLPTVDQAPARRARS
ncbi:hypothetical protein [Ideonella sp. A 288]|uniref:hypothetical protein n=1 Tax=Ideonella sp. A 288 TaxID=1962181 RepID=UPI000B4B753A|nr:hypothetical protein [Ideonella sp. A 288]